MTTLHRLLYRSRSALEGSKAEIDEALLGLAGAARGANRSVDVTGALLCSSGVFVQALEGPPAAVERIFERICGDLRHHDVQLIDFAAAEARSFSEWSMALLNSSNAFMDLATMTAIERTAIDATSAGATIQLLRALILSGPPQPQETTFAT